MLVPGLMVSFRQAATAAITDCAPYGPPVADRVAQAALCPDPGCPVGSFVEQNERVAAPRAKLTAWRADARSGRSAVITPASAGSGAS